ncbi:uncharacterized protein LOC121668290 [Corvus kubaryi]|uniref:uncharacterized protein LOC121668290 n=1 Tax=Corvus kubaryi TaxID=68294 RepID=UPI001C052E95|nr:uncharacterized protein LOC121668290 [Corvus kubaryi]XP_041891867.1 uncharacterized protein LOC121668290 [Corvus kubaryi]
MSEHGVSHEVPDISQSRAPPPPSPVHVITHDASPIPAAAPGQPLPPSSLTPKWERPRLGGRGPGSRRAAAAERGSLLHSASGCAPRSSTALLVLRDSRPQPGLGSDGIQKLSRFPPAAQLQAATARPRENWSSFPEDDSSITDSESEPDYRWTQTQREATREGDWELAQKIATFPVVLTKGRRGTPTIKRIREPIPYREIKELCKVAKEYGQESPYFKNLLQVTLSTFTLVPRDIKNIMSCLLSPMEHMLWEWIWIWKTRQLLQTYQRDRTRAHLTAEHLSGERDFERPQDQAQIIPEAVLGDIKRAAEAALLQVADDATPTLNFSDIGQGTEESY